MSDDPRREGIARFVAHQSGQGVGPDDAAGPEETGADEPTPRTVTIPPPPKPPLPPAPTVDDSTDTVDDGGVATEPAPAAPREPDAPVGRVEHAAPAPRSSGTPRGGTEEIRARSVAAGIGAARIGGRAARSDRPDPADYGQARGNVRRVATTLSARTAERLDKLRRTKNQTLSRTMMDAVRNHWRTVLSDLAPEPADDDPFGTPPVALPREPYGVRKEFTVTPQEAETLARISYEAGINPSALIRGCVEREVADL